MLVALYAIFVIIVAFVRPKWVPALPPEARIYREPNGSSGHNSLFVLLGISRFGRRAVEPRTSSGDQPDGRARAASAD